MSKSYFTNNWCAAQVPRPPEVIAAHVYWWARSILIIIQIRAFASFSTPFYIYCAFRSCFKNETFTNSEWRGDKHAGTQGSAKTIGKWGEGSASDYSGKIIAKQSCRNSFCWCLMSCKFSMRHPHPFKETFVRKGELEMCHLNYYMSNLQIQNAFLIHSLTKILES